MKVWHIVLFVVVAGIVYLWLTRKTRRAVRETRTRERRESDCSIAAAEADRLFGEELSAMSSSDIDDAAVGAALAHVMAVQSSWRKSGPLLERTTWVDAEWMSERVRAHAKVIGCSEAALGRNAAECTLALLDEAIHQMRSLDSELVQRGASFHQFTQARNMSQIPNNMQRAQRLATRYVTTYGDSRQKALLASMTY
jgi:hypothetical protein